MPPRVAEEREWAAGAATGVFCLFLLGSDSNGLDNCSTDRDNEELSIDLEKALRGDNVGLQSFGVVAAKKYNINDIYIKQQIKFHLDEFFSLNIDEIYIQLWI